MILYVSSTASRSARRHLFVPMPKGSTLMPVRPKGRVSWPVSRSADIAGPLTRRKRPANFVPLQREWKVCGSDAKDAAMNLSSLLVAGPEVHMPESRLSRLRDEMISEAGIFLSFRFQRVARILIAFESNITALGQRE